MCPEKKQKLNELRRRLSTMSKEEEARLLAERGIVATIDGHVLSPRNRILLAWQGCEDAIVGGFQQWKRAGRHVRAGEHGAAIFFPRIKKTDPDEGPELAGFLTVSVFGKSQTEAYA